MANKQYIPSPVFDTYSKVLEQYKAVHDSTNPRQVIRLWLNHCFSTSPIKIPAYATKDYQWVLHFLYGYRGSQDTFKAYRRDLERLIQWSWFVRDQSILKHKREDIEAFVEFCMKPYKRWIGLKTVARFKKIKGEKVSNPEWRPFDVRLSKIDRYHGKEATKEQYQFSHSALKVMFGILSSFYKYLQEEELIVANPVALIRQKSKFIRKDATLPVIRRLSDMQWNAVMSVAQSLANTDPKHERTLFIISCLYGMYLRISELTASDRWTPTMGDFYKDADGNWWFKTVGKGNKARQITVSQSMLVALKRYRKHLGLTPYPVLDEATPLIAYEKNDNKSVKGKRWIRTLVQQCFDTAADNLEIAEEQNEADQLRTATVHWLRHTGISDDVKVRPREHVRDDAGHSSGAITDKYIDVELRARANSAKKKKKMTEAA